MYLPPITLAKVIKDQCIVTRKINGSKTLYTFLKSYNLFQEGNLTISNFQIYFPLSIEQLKIKIYVTGVQFSRWQHE